MKEGDLMNEFKELDVLENADDTVKERLAEEFPPQDSNEKERVFRMSERKYNIKKNNNADRNFVGEEIVKGVEVYKRPKWKIFASLAACAVIVAGIGGGGYLMKMMNNSRPVPSASEVQSEVQTEVSAVTEKKAAPFGDFSKIDYFLCGNDPDNIASHIEMRGEGYENGVMVILGGDAIPQDKRSRLADFFNSYTWEAVSVDGSEIESYRTDENGDPSIYNKDLIKFAYSDEKEIRTIEILPNNVLVYNHFDISVDENGKQYIDMNKQQTNTEFYKAEYELIKDTINNILNEEGNVPPEQCDDLEVIVQTLEKYTDFHLQDSPDELSLSYKIIGDDFEAEKYLGSEIDKEKHEKMLSVIKNADWSSAPMSESERNEIADDPHFKAAYSLIEKTGNDFIDLQIWENHVGMKIMECEYNEADNTYILKNQRYYEMRTTSPTFMSDIYEVLIGSSVSEQTSKSVTIKDDASLLDKIDSAELHLIDKLRYTDPEENNYAHQRFIKCGDSEYAQFLYGSRMNEEQNRKFKDLIKNTALTPVAYDSIDWIKDAGIKPYEMFAYYAFMDVDNFITVSMQDDSRLYIMSYECSKADKSDPAFAGIEKDNIRNEMYRDEYYQCSEIHVAVFDIPTNDFFARADEIYNGTTDAHEPQFSEVHYSDPDGCFIFGLNFPYEKEGLNGKYIIDFTAECDGLTNTGASGAFNLLEMDSMPISIYPIEGAVSNNYTVTMRLTNVDNNKSVEFLNYTFDYSSHINNIIAVDMWTAFRSIQ